MLPLARQPDPVSSADRGEAFVRLLPAIRAHARAAFRAVRCPHARDDAEAEVVARAWERFRAEPDSAALTPDRLAAPAVAAVRAARSRARD